MDRKPLPETFGSPFYSFYGNNTSYHFVKPGDYNIRMSMSPQTSSPSDDTRTQVFNSSTEVNTNFVGWKTPERRTSGQIGTPLGTKLQSGASPNGNFCQPPPSSPGPNTVPQSPLGNNMTGLENFPSNLPSSPTTSLSGNLKPFVYDASTSH